MLNSKHNREGFTLLEMLVVVAIISLMSSLVISNYNSQKKAKEMQFAGQEIADSIRKAQNYSINIKKFENYNISGGYGTHFTDGGSSFIIFLDDSVNKNKTYGPEDYVVETVDFPPGINVENLNGGAVGVADLVFEPPYGKVYMSFNGALQSPTPSLSIQIKKDTESCPAFCKTVSINSQGQVN